MTERSIRAAAALLALLLAIGLAACSGSAPGTPSRGCVPRYPYSSDDRIRAGRSVTITVGAGTCRATFDHADRRLGLTWVDASGRRTRLATVRAYPSGAFEQEVRIPEGSAAGVGTLLVTGVAVPCADTGSCAAYGATLTVVRSTPDFAAPTAANGAAERLAQRVHTVLQSDQAWLQVAIVTDGLDLWLHTDDADAETARVSRAIASARAATPPADRVAVSAARIHLRFARHARTQLTDLRRRIERDRSGWLADHAIQPTGWGVSWSADAVELLLPHYSDAVARQLVTRYGEALVVRPVGVNTRAA